jgi:hypothetical protein
LASFTAMWLVRGVAMATPQCTAPRKVTITTP